MNSVSTACFSQTLISLNEVLGNLYFIIYQVRISAFLISENSTWINAFWSYCYTVQSTNDEENSFQYHQQQKKTLHISAFPFVKRKIKIQMFPQNWETLCYIDLWGIRRGWQIPDSLPSILAVLSVTAIHQTSLMLSNVSQACIK